MEKSEVILERCKSTDIADWKPPIRVLFCVDSKKDQVRSILLQHIQHQELKLELPLSSGAINFTGEKSSDSYINTNTPGLIDVQHEGGDNCGIFSSVRIELSWEKSLQDLLEERRRLIENVLGLNLKIHKGKTTR